MAGSPSLHVIFDVFRLESSFFKEVPSLEPSHSAFLHVIFDVFRRESSFFKDDPSNKATIFLE